MSVVLADVSQGYGTLNVIDQLSLTLSPGVTALVGPDRGLKIDSPSHAGDRHATAFRHGCY